MIRIYYSKTFKSYLHKLLTCFLIGGICSFMYHSSDYLYYNEAFPIIRDANKKLKEMKKITFPEKWAKRYIARGKALVDNGKPTAREKRNRREFEQLWRKYK